jgi:dTDP-4-amino-4,6-dideoxygalactose transaminase
MTEIQAVIGREQLKLLDKQIVKRNLIAKLYLSELKDYYEKYKVFKKPNFKCQSCPLKENKKKCNKCLHAFYRLNLYLNINYKENNKNVNLRSFCLLKIKFEIIIFLLE